MQTTNIIEIASCVFKYPQSQRIILDINPFHVRSGGHLFLHGKSGSGKTTFLNILCGITEPLKSDIKILETLRQGKARSTPGAEPGEARRCDGRVQAADRT